MADLSALYDLWTNAHVRRYLWDNVVISRERCLETLKAALQTAEADSIGCWTLRPIGSRAVVGDCGFQFISGSRDIELFCCLRKEYCGLGLAFEACQAALQYVWTSTLFEQVYSRVDAPNEGSIRLMERLGMKYRGVDGHLLSYVLLFPSESEPPRP